MVGMIKDIGPGFNSSIHPPLQMTLRPRSWTMNFYVIVLNNSYLPDPTMDLVYSWYDDRYRSNVLFSYVYTPSRPLPPPLSASAHRRTLLSKDSTCLLFVVVVCLFVCCCCCRRCCCQCFACRLFFVTLSLCLVIVWSSPSSFWYLEKAVLRDCGLFWVTIYIYLAFGVSNLLKDIKTYCWIWK